MREPGDKSYRERAGAVIIDTKKKQVLLMYRVKDGQAKYVIPGGGVEAGESPEETAIREIQEELNLDIVPGRKLLKVSNIRSQEHYFLTTIFSGTLRLGGEELERSGPDNIYRPEWLSLSDLEQTDLPIFPEAIIPLIKKELSSSDS